MTDAIEAVDWRLSADKLMVALSDRERSIVRARMDGWLLREIAEAQGISAPAVRIVEQRALHKMRRRLMRFRNIFRGELV